MQIIYYLKALKLFINFCLDFKRFLKWSSASNQISTQTNLKALITMDYHRLEKGLALKKPKIGFGKDVIERISHLLPEYQNKYDSDEIVNITLDALQEYYDFNLEFGVDNQTAYQTITTIKNNITKKNPLVDLVDKLIDQREILCEQIISNLDHVKKLAQANFISII